jgi:hypothetical protein
MPDLRALTLKALMNAGGVSYLEEQARENPGPFMGLLGKVMPREVHTELTAEVRHRHEVRRDLVEKLLLLMQTNAPAVNDPHMTVVSVPALAHVPDAMLQAQVNQDREGLSPRAENARRDGADAVAGAVQRGAAMHLERSRQGG